MRQDRPTVLDLMRRLREYSDRKDMHFQFEYRHRRKKEANNKA